MERLANELLLLMLNLSRMRDTDRMVALFVEALDAATPGVRVRRGDGTPMPGRCTVEELATPDARFGWIVIEDPEGRLGPSGHASYRNAIRMLAVVLENATRAALLARDNALLDEAVAARTAELQLRHAEALAAQQALGESEQRLRQAQKLEAVGRLAGGVAHDFNNMLTVILSGADALLDGLDRKDPMREEAAQIFEAATRAAAVTRQLLAFARCHPNRPVPLDLGETVGEMERLLSRLIGEDIELVIERAAGLPRVLADPGQIEQTIVNLAVNARDAMPDGGRLTIATRTVPASEADDERPWVELAVGDTGVGMSPEVKARLFEPFFTTKEQGKGTGLGLASLYGIVTHAGGTIAVESAPGQGSRFRVRFPGTEVVPEVPEAIAPRRRLRGSETVLLVEDEPQLRAAAARGLRSAGYTILEAGSGEEALAVAAEAARLDLLCSDVVMPGLRGPALAARLCRLRPDLRVLFMSGYNEREGVVEAVQRGEATFLQKPFTVADLTRAVRAALHRPLHTP